MTRIRIQIAFLLLGVTIAWPAVHMVLTRWTDISPWRFGGWGMYSIPHESNTTIHIYLLDEKAGKRNVPEEVGVSAIDWLEGVLTRLERGRPLAVFRPAPRGFTRVRLGLWPSNFGEDLDKRVRTVQALGGEYQVERLMRWLANTEDPIKESANAIVVLGKPRVCLGERRSCIEKTVYLTKGEDVTYFARFLNEEGWMDSACAAVSADKCRQWTLP